MQEIALTRDRYLVSFLSKRGDLYYGRVIQEGENLFGGVGKNMNTEGDLTIRHNSLINPGSKIWYREKTEIEIEGKLYHLVNNYAIEVVEKAVNDYD